MSMKHSKRSIWIKSIVAKLNTLVAVGFLCCAFGACSQSYDQKEAERYIRESESAWAESVATGDGSVIQRILADDFTGVDP